MPLPIIHRGIADNETSDHHNIQKQHLRVLYCGMTARYKEYSSDVIVARIFTWKFYHR